MTPTFRKYDEGDRFMLSEEHDCADGDSIGVGTSMKLTRFGSAEAREYYIQVQILRDALRRATDTRCFLVDGLRAALKKRNIRKRILELLDA